MSKKQLFARIVGGLRGRAVKEVIFGETEITTRAFEDLQQITQIARKMVTMFGMSEIGLWALTDPAVQSSDVVLRMLARNSMSEKLAEDIDNSVRQIIEAAYEIARNNCDAVDKLVDSKQCAATASPSQSQRFEGNNKTPSPFPKKPPTTSPSRSFKKKTLETPPLLSDAFLNNPDLSPFLLRLAHDTIASGDGPSKALNFAIRASKSFERCAVEGEPNLDLAISLHVLAAIYCSLGRFEEAVPVLKHSIQVPDIERGADHALAAFSSYMQLDDTFSMLD
ncbi:hypothetical protein JHK87_049478 [Glycine soja]|nr:hypothetical protein JHK87_049478 [Glycine soja]